MNPAGTLAYVTDSGDSKAYPVDLATMTAGTPVNVLPGPSFLRSEAGKKLAKPVVGIASTNAGDGYWLVAGVGGIFNFGTAGFHGSLGAAHLANPVVAVAATLAGTVRCETRGGAESDVAPMAH